MAEPVSSPGQTYDTKPPEDDDALLKQARDEYQDGIDADQQNRIDALDDLQFYSGEQWDDAVKTARINAGRPTVTINRMPQFVRQVTGDIRLNRPAIRVSPFDDNDDVETAEIFEGLIRSIEGYSNADEAYISGIESAARCGVGHWRVVTDYVPDSVDEQEILIKRILDPFAVVWDPYAVEATRSDARYCFVTQKIPRKAYQERYPDSPLNGFDENLPPYLHAWVNRDEVTIAEYWRKVPTTKEIVRLDDGSVYDLSKTPKEELAEITPRITKRRTVNTHKICWYKMSGFEILERGEWAGKYIPIVSVFGEEVYVADRVVRGSVIRHSKDAQRLYNLGRSAQTELAAAQPKAPFIVSSNMVKNYPDMWNAMGVENRPYLVIDADPQMPGGPVRLNPAPISPAFSEMVQLSDNDMKATTGIYDASLGKRSNETSGRAITARQQEGDVSTFTFIDNGHRAIRHTGMILVDLIPKIMDTDRIARILGEDGNAEHARLAPTGLKKPIELARGAPLPPPDQLKAMSANSNAPPPQAAAMGMPPMLGAMPPVPMGPPPGAMPQPPGPPMTAPQGAPPVPPASNVVPFPAPKKPAMQKVYDLSVGRFDVRIDSGPSFTTKRQEAAASMADLIKAAPALMNVAGDILVRNMDWPGAEELSERLRKTLPPGLAEPRDDDPPPQPQPPSPEAMKAQADMAKTQADIELLRVKSAHEQTMAQADLAQLQAKAQADQQAAQAKVQLAQADLAMKQVELQLKQAELQFRQMELEATRQAQEREHALKAVAMAGDSMQLDATAGQQAADQQHEQTMGVMQGQQDEAQRAHERAMAGHEAQTAAAERQHAQDMAGQQSGADDAQRQHEAEMAAEAAKQVKSNATD